MLVKGTLIPFTLLLAASAGGAAAAPQPQEQRIPAAGRNSDEHHQTMMPSQGPANRLAEMGSRPMMDCPTMHRQVMSELHALREELARLREAMHHSGE